MRGLVRERVGVSAQRLQRGRDGGLRGLAWMAGWLLHTGLQHTGLARSGCQLLVADQQEPCAPVSWGWRLCRDGRVEARRMEAVGETGAEAEAERAAALRCTAEKWAGATLPRWSFFASSRQNDRWAAVN